MRHPTSFPAKKGRNKKNIILFTVAASLRIASVVNNHFTPNFSTYTLLKSDGKWHGSCAAGNGNEGECELGLALCVEIAPTATAEAMEERMREETNGRVKGDLVRVVFIPLHSYTPP